MSGLHIKKRLECRIENSEGKRTKSIVEQRRLVDEFDLDHRGPDIVASVRIRGVFTEEINEASPKRHRKKVIRKVEEHAVEGNAENELLLRRDLKLCFKLCRAAAVMRGNQRNNPQLHILLCSLLVGGGEGSFEGVEVEAHGPGGGEEERHVRYLRLIVRKVVDELTILLAMAENVGIGQKRNFRGAKKI